LTNGVRRRAFAFARRTLFVLLPIFVFFFNDVSFNDVRARSRSEGAGMTLDPLALEGDPLADRVIDDLVAADSIAAVNAVLDHLRTNETPIPEDLPDSVREYLIATDNPPDWADTDRIARARCLLG
jgi:hypothetical protein